MEYFSEVTHLLQTGPQGTETLARRASARREMDELFEYVRELDRAVYSDKYDTDRKEHHPEPHAVAGSQVIWIEKRMADLGAILGRPYMGAPAGQGAEADFTAFVRNVREYEHSL